MNMISAYKGIAPGRIIANELNHRKMTQRDLAVSIGEHYQTICSIIKGHRGIPLETSVKLDNIFGFERGFFAIIQTYYALESIEEHSSESSTKAIPNIRPVVFWDIDMSSLDWQKHKDFIIERVLSRGNAQEIQQVRDYYGIAE